MIAQERVHHLQLRSANCSDYLFSDEALVCALISAGLMIIDAAMQTDPICLRL